jgi:DNA segregation ATPase FtsK/SpoIIIE, S-DNA-T family
MAAKKRISFGDDPRSPKLVGMLCLFIALYLFIAFTSYLFTGHDDQSVVSKWSTDLIFSNIAVTNWLGRFGAVVSDFFINLLFGLPSYFLVYILVQYGIAIVNDLPLSRFHTRFRNSTMWMIVLSVLLGFFFYKFTFPFGGLFGHSVSEWLINFVGPFGMMALVLFSVMGLIIWTFNPDLQGLTLEKAIQNTKESILELWDGRYHTQEQRSQTFAEKRQKRTSSTTNTANPSTDAEGQAELDAIEAEDPQVSLAPIKAGEKSLIEDALGLDAGVPKIDGSEFVSTGLGVRKPSLKVGEAELEIETNDTANPDVDTSGSVAEPSKVPVLPGVQGNLFRDGVPDNYGDISTPYDPTLDLSAYEYPVLPLLLSYEDTKIEVDRAELEQNKDQIIETLLNYKIEITKIRATVGPTVTLYEIIPAPGVRISRIKNLEDDIALSLAALGIRIIAPIPGKGTIGIEVPNKNKQTVSLREVLASERFRKSDMELPIALGKTISNEVFVADLAKMPHLLIAGATGQGKSVGINTILLSLLYKKHPSQLKLVLVDPKKVELSPYSKIENHFLAYLPDQLEPIITDTAKVVNTLNSLCIEMDQRYELLKKAQARNIKEYNEKFVGRRLNPEKGHRYLPFIVLVIDEFADLIMTAGKEVELPIGRLAQLARAVGIHLIIATQRPSVNIITGVIKANFPARLAFKVTSKIDSRTILDNSGAEQLIGRGDMLISAGSDIVRLQCAFVDTPEVERVIDFISQQPGYATPFFLPEFTSEGEQHGAASFNMEELDDMIEDAARLVVQNQHGSTSMIQRRLKLGYNRAGRIMDQLEHLGIVGPNEGSKPREVLFHDDHDLTRFFMEFNTKRM